ncbi:DNA repair protein [Dichomitus squalens LYAD-421 SS1]|uniref:DNA repair protein n=1 Tax=Dichomitus squalens (strain LYAD-421) TaxID=732165 RepID=UPI0004413BA9|nr:DNA repair protein [Dichomitus squalens LYAD-421 SS1]EJF62757.1 DNA repair protein [Dichomitus squalens LYAD-421 SS1]
MALTQGSNHSSDYFDDDPEFLKAITQVAIPGDAAPSPIKAAPTKPTIVDLAQDPFVDPDEPPSPTQRTLKRQRSPDDDLYADDEDGAQYHSVLNAVDGNDRGHDEAYLQSYTYGASRFGEFGEYMVRKRAKLQVQNREIEDDEDETTPKSRIFAGLQIYINGWTEPSVQDLRKMIVQNGGIYHPYLDKKSLVTHIITCSLTPAKVREFKYMKVVKPDWLLDSLKAGTLLPWQNYVFRPGERVEATQGRKAPQKSLFGNFVTQTKRPPPIAQATASGSRAGGADPPMAVDNDDEDGDWQASQPEPSQISGTPSPPQTPQKMPFAPHKPVPTTPSSRAPFTTDPTTPEHAARVPGYAAHKSNPHAERAMKDPAWRAAHTSVAPDFIEGYYRNSRLHHLSAWKAELKNLVAEAQERAESGGAETWKKAAGERRASAGGGEGGAEGVARSASQEAVERIVRENLGGHGLGSTELEGDVSMKGARLVKRAAQGKGKGKEKAVDEERVIIMHCDFDSFFVSAGLVDRPHLRGKPVVVCHSQGSTGGAASTSEIASASYEAREFGIKGGMSLQQARKLCPAVITIPYEFQRRVLLMLYKQFSLQFYTILMAHADDLQAVSVDEALIDVTSSVTRIRAELAQRPDRMDDGSDPAKDFAESIRAQVRKVTGCEVSIGIAHNIMLARVASRKAKPGGSYHLRPEDVAEQLAPLDIDALHGFGYSTRQKAEEKLGTANLGQLMKKSRAVLCEALGKGTGETLYKALRGIDDRRLESDKPRKSVSCDINYGIRFENNEQAETFVYQMAEEVSRRLQSIDMRGRSITLKVLTRDPNAPVEAPKFMGHGICEAHNKQIPLIAPGGRATSDEKIIGEHAWRMLKSFNFDPKELRGVSIQIQKLEKGSGSQEAELGQALLPFKRVEASKQSGAGEPSTSRATAPQIAVQPPSQDSDIEIIRSTVKAAAPANANIDLPSFSQVDMSVFEALPEDLRKELEAEYKRRSATPQAGPAPKDRSPAAEPAPRKKSTLKSTNVKRITQQLAPRNRPFLSPTNKLFGHRVYASSVKVSERELRKYGIDPEVFAALPPEMQREQLAAHRAPGVTVHVGTRKVLKPSSGPRGRSSKSPGIVFRPPPAPKAVYLAAPTLKQQGKAKGEKLCFREKEDLQAVIESWVGSFTEHAPNQRDVDYFAKFLVQSVDGDLSADSGVEKAVAVVKWWLVLLRRHFGAWEHAPEVEGDAEVGARPKRVTSEYVGRAWWRAFREVKAKMDAAARKRYGGSLSLK